MHYKGDIVNSSSLYFVNYACCLCTVYGVVFAPFLYSQKVMTDYLPIIVTKN